MHCSGAIIAEQREPKTVSGEGGSLREKEEAQLVLGLMVKNKSVQLGGSEPHVRKKAKALVT